MKQEALPVDDRPGRAEQCGWCGQPATTEIELEPAQYTHRKGPDGKKLKLVKRSPLMAPVCTEHYLSLGRVRKDGS